MLLAETYPAMPSGTSEVGGMLNLKQVSEQMDQHNNNPIRHYSTAAGRSGLKRMTVKRRIPLCKSVDGDRGQGTKSSIGCQSRIPRTLSQADVDDRRIVEEQVMQFAELAVRRGRSVGIVRACAKLLMAPNLVADTDRLRLIMRIREISAYPDGKDMLHIGAAIPCVVKQLIDPALADAAVSTVANLAASSTFMKTPISEQLMEAGVVKQLVALLEFASSSGVRQRCMRALANIAVLHDEYKDRICAAEGMLQQLVRALKKKSYGSSALQCGAAMLFSSLCLSNGSACERRVRILAQHGAVAALVETMLGCDDLALIRAVLPIVQDNLKTCSSEFYGPFASSNGHLAFEGLLRSLVRMEQDEDEILRTQQVGKDFEVLEEEVDLLVQHQNLVNSARSVVDQANQIRQRLGVRHALDKCPTVDLWCDLGQSPNTLQLPANESQIPRTHSVSSSSSASSAGSSPEDSMVPKPRSQTRTSRAA
eukprot:m.238626 g.238626  ORF g.238626 m.238626 type:complete len:480 (-) comp19393_c0_seq1:514-1953(-)